MWFQKKMEKIKWAKRKTNNEVLNLVEEKKNFVKHYKNEKIDS